MKKILTATIAALAIAGSGIAQTEKDSGLFAIATMGLIGGANQTVMYHEDGTTAFSSASGYIATIWYGGTSSDPNDLVFYEATVFGDVIAAEIYGMGASSSMAAGTLQWQSDVPSTLEVGDKETHYFSIRVFYAPTIVALWEAAPNEWGKITLTTQDLAQMWEDALEGDKNVGDFAYTVKTDDYKFPGVADKTNNSLLSTATDGKLVGYIPVPEPSTWLLLGAGAAFTVIMRRRRK